MRLYSYLFLVLVATTPMMSHAEKYTTKSVFNADYKCSAEEAGGFNHRAAEHKLDLFKPEEEFFLVHISNIPQKAVFEMKSKEIVALLGGDEDRVRKEVESSYMKQESYVEGFMSEKSSYFIREPRDNPEKRTTYMARKSCSAWKSDTEKEKDSLITCFESDGSKTFQFSPKTGRFTYSYSGSWHVESSKDYHGDSSIFVFGSCQEYYR